MTKIKSFGRTHPVVTALFGVLAVVVALVGWQAVSIARSFAPVSVDYTVPPAPQLEATGADETVYRIDASRSEVRYEVQENLAGSEHTATGTTYGVAGDVLIDDADPSASQVGEFVVDVKQLTSDESLRDNRLRHEFLQSDTFPLARFVTTSVDGLPEVIDDGTEYDLTLEGDLTVKTTTLPATVDVVARRQNDELHLQGSTSVKLSDFDVGPISLTGLVSTGDDAELVFDLLAVNAAEVDVPEVVSKPGDEERAEGGPSFSKTVQPILEQSCASCHEPEGSGSGEWTVDTAEDAAEFASGLGLVTETRYMPPWLASEEGVPLQHSMRLSDDEIAAVQAWADAGGPLDVDPSSPIRATKPDVRPPRRDAELHLPEPYQGTPTVQNDYRCFVLDPGLTEPAAITGYEFLPDQVEIVHHSLVYRLDGSLREAVDAQDAAAEGPGWQCFGGINAGGAGLSPNGTGGGSDLVMGWAPGQQPTTYPDGTALQVQPDEFFVVQLHYHITHEAPPDSSGFAIEYHDGDPTELDDVQVTTYLAPAEIPCLPEDDDAPLCDRAAEMAELFRLYGGQGPGIANGLHLLCGTTPEELAHLDADGIAYSSCDHRVRNEGEILSVLGHMHEIGATYRMTLNPDTDDEKILLDIPRWDFDWQLNYVPEETIVLKRGDTIRVECSWDRNLFPVASEPHFVSWAEGTEDEMCFSTVATREARD
jgi:polyisoprenoid-binding protein YceI/mono/diheme cytochrome c family protein